VDLGFCPVSKSVRYGPSVTSGSHSFTTCYPHTNQYCLYFPAARPTALWLVLIAPTYEGMARLSWLR